MVKNASQQGNGSHNNTPQMQSTPSIAQAMPGNRQLSATPRLQPGSPAINMQQGTPGMAAQMTPNPMMMQNGGYNNPQGLTAEQMQLLQMQRSNDQQGAHHAQNPQQFQFASRVARIQQEMKLTAEAYKVARAQGDMVAAQAHQNRIQMLRNSHEKLQNAARQQQLAAANGNPNMTPHGHPSQLMSGQQQQQQHNTQNAAEMQNQLMAQQQAQQQRLRQQQQIQHILTQHGGQVPPQVLATMTPGMQQVIRAQMAKNSPQAQQQAQMAALRRQQMQQQQGGQMGVGGGGQMGTQEYMQQMQQQKINLAMQLQAQQQMAGQQGSPIQGLPQNFGMGANGMGGMQGGMTLQQQQAYQQAQFAAQQQVQQQQQQRDPSNLDAQFAATLASITNGQQQQGGGQQGGGGRMQ
jgi:transcription factor SPT20